MKKFYSLLIALLLVAFSTKADVTITVDTPGTLEELLFDQDQEEYENIAVLIIKGSINDDDLSVIRSMSAEYALKTIDLSGANLPNNQLPALAFNKENCAIQHIILPESLESFVEDGSTPFHQNILSVKIPTTKLKVIPEHAFTWCTQLTELVIPEGVTTLGKESLVFCSSLRTLTLPSTLTTIKEGAILGDIGFTEGFPIPLVDIYAYMPTPPAMENAAVVLGGGYWQMCTLHVPQGTVELYKNNKINDWYGFGFIDNILEISGQSINMEDASTLKIYSSAKNTITIEGAELGSMVSVYNISGVLVKSFIMGADVDSFELSDSGIYIVKVGTQVSKIIL